MRKEQKNQTRVNKVYGHELKLTGEKAKKINTNSFNGQRISEETNNQILALKAKHEAERDKFEVDIKSL
jgi:hypothetical protein